MPLAQMALLDIQPWPAYEWAYPFLHSRAHSKTVVSNTLVQAGDVCTDSLTEMRNTY
jgi:hypothetical protein